MQTQHAPKDRIIYSISTEDVKDVLEDMSEVRLTARQIKMVEEKLGDYIDWYGALELAIQSTIRQTRTRKKNEMPHYEVLFYNGWTDTPAYYLVGDIEGEIPEEALATNLNQVIEIVRGKFSLDDDRGAERFIREYLYVVREGGLLSARER